MKSDIRKKAGSCWFVLVFFVFCCYAGYGAMFDGGEQLNGVVDSGEAVACSAETVMDGSYQAYLNTYFEQNFLGRKLLIHLRSQMLYSICGISPNENVIIGKDKYLYEPWYITQELQIAPPSSGEYFAELGEKLCRLRDTMAENGKELYVFISPSKAHYFREKIPLRYEFLSNEGEFETNDHEELVKMLEEREISFFDSMRYLEENIGRYESPLFYQSGIHWSHVWGESAAAEFLGYMDSKSRWDLDVLQVDEFVSEEPIAPDTDLYDSLNLFTVPHEKWYGTQISLVKEGADKPNVFLRGSSFMGQSLNMLIRQGVFGRDVHLENYYYFTDRYTQAGFLSDYGAYDELDMETLVGQTDILILEVNDAGISNMGMGFIDYLLEHTEYLSSSFIGIAEAG